MRTDPAKEDEAKPQILSKPGLGDLTERFFFSLGITKDRYRAAKAAVGLEPDCNCDARKKWLNELGGRLGVDKVVLKMAKWMDERKF
jgi:hypothetical protein